MNITLHPPDEITQFAEVLLTGAPDAEKSIEPMGTVVTVPGEESDTVAVHVDVWFTLTGVQLTFVEVLLRITLIVYAGLTLDK